MQLAEALLANGANPSARNRRGAEPLHYAADGVPTSAAWNPAAQAALVRLLLRQNTGRSGSGSTESRAQQREIVKLLRDHAARSR